MQLTAKIKLLPTLEQSSALRETLERANAACEYISGGAWQKRVFQQYDLHKLTYREVRERFGLSAQMAVRCISKVVDAYKLDRHTLRTFRPQGAIAYDARVLQYGSDYVSVWTVSGRIKVKYTCGQHQRAQLATQKGESDLLLTGAEFYLCATCVVEEPAAVQPSDALGVDLGIVNIATDSDGHVFSGAKVNSVRHRHRRLRRKLQAKGTKSARKRLRKLSGKERRFARDVNHVIAKTIVAKAKDTNRAIALEDLKGIRKRVTARRPQRAMLHSWSFYQLRLFITYKAVLAGVPVFLVDPWNTSRTCPCCGCIDKANRPNQHTFSCVACGFAGLADHKVALRGAIAATNIRDRGRAHVNAPNVSTLAICTPPSKPVSASGTSPRLQVGGS